MDLASPTRVGARYSVLHPRPQVGGCILSSATQHNMRDLLLGQVLYRRSPIAEGSQTNSAWAWNANDVSVSPILIGAELAPTPLLRRWRCGGSPAPSRSRSRGGTRGKAPVSHAERAGLLSRHGFAGEQPHLSVRRGSIRPKRTRGADDRRLARLSVGRHRRCLPAARRAVYDPAALRQCGCRRHVQPVAGRRSDHHARSNQRADQVCRPRDHRRQATGADALRQSLRHQ